MANRTKYGLIVADPPWKFGDNLPGKGRGSAKHYRCMTVSEIMRYPLPALLDDCFLFLWRVAAMQQEALHVGRAWGFTLKSEITWIKVPTTIRMTQKIREINYHVREFDDPKTDALRDHLIAEAGIVAGRRVRIGMGRTVRLAHEVCLVLTRGRPKVHNRSVSSVIFAPRIEHSRKPEELQTKAELIAGPDVPRIELFARRQRDGWTCVGDQLTAAQAAE